MEAIGGVRDRVVGVFQSEESRARADAEAQLSVEESIRQHPMTSRRRPGQREPERGDVGGDGPEIEEEDAGE